MSTGKSAGSVPSPTRGGDFAALLRLTRTIYGQPAESSAMRRRMIADFCRMVAVNLGTLSPDACNNPNLTPRMRQTLERLLAGDSEKEVAAKLRVSPHTVHVYVKALYRQFEVSSRGELLAKCLGGEMRSMTETSLME